MRGGFLKTWIIFIAAIGAMFFFAAKPAKKIFEYALRFVAGGIVIAIINALGFTAHIPLNAVSASAVGAFGIPGIIMMAIMTKIL